jgi:hypothetical protein
MARALAASFLMKPLFVLYQACAGNWPLCLRCMAGQSLLLFPLISVPSVELHFTGCKSPPVLLGLLVLETRKSKKKGSSQRLKVERRYHAQPRWTCKGPLAWPGFFQRAGGSFVQPGYGILATAQTVHVLSLRGFPWGLTAAIVSWRHAVRVE